MRCWRWRLVRSTCICDACVAWHQPQRDQACACLDVGTIDMLHPSYVDMEKMPLGKLSKSHIKKGYSVLTEIQAVIDAGSDESKLLALSNQCKKEHTHTNTCILACMRTFTHYTCIPLTRTFTRLVVCCSPPMLRVCLSLYTHSTRFWYQECTTVAYGGASEGETHSGMCM